MRGILLRRNQTERAKFLKHKRLNTNEKIPRKKVITCTNITKLKLKAYFYKSYKASAKNQVENTVQGLEAVE